MSRFPREAAVALTASLLIPAGGLAASDASAEYMAADPSITDPSPTPWERLEIGPDGQSLRVYFSTGAAGCNGLARVEVDRSADVPVVTVWTGLHPDAAVRICKAGEYDYYTEVALDAPVVLDGSTTSHTSSKGYQDAMSWSVDRDVTVSSAGTTTKSSRPRGAMQTSSTAVTEMTRPSSIPSTRSPGPRRSSFRTDPARSGPPMRPRQSSGSHPALPARARHHLLVRHRPSWSSHRANATPRP